GYLAGDDTDGHIDMLARFCSPDTLVYARCDDPHDEHYREYRAMAQQLRDFRNTTGKPYICRSLPLPPPVYNAGGQRLPASYANFLITNAAVLVPVYGARTDAEACSVLAACFPERRIVPVNCLPLIQQFGSLHCATLQLAAGILSTRPSARRAAGESHEGHRQ
ncbi:MAG: agmatine deiminase family protein, partial [Gammaproteobacteria bacterium]